MAWKIEDGHSMGIMVLVSRTVLMENKLSNCYDRFLKGFSINCETVCEPGKANDMLKGHVLSQGWPKNIYIK